MAADDKTNTPSIEEILKEARVELASIKICTETSKAIAAEAIESQKVTVGALTDVKTKLDEITIAATQAVAAKTQIAGEQAVIATKSDHIQKAQEWDSKSKYQRWARMRWRSRHLLQGFRHMPFDFSYNPA